MLVGRARETTALANLLTAARAGHGSAIVLRGEAGVGKSALLGYARSSADGFLILAAVGIESEAELAFAGLHQLVLPVLSQVGALPAPQSAALSAAFGLSDETVAERFRISLGVLGLLTAAAEQQPVLCIVDDAQWLDEASAGALLFAARRLAADRVAVVFAARDDERHPFPAPGVPELRVDPLAEEDAHRLACARLGAGATPEALSWVLGNAAGNPLALVELPQALTDGQRAGRDPLADRLPPATSVERAYVERVAQLPHVVQQALLVAAAEDTEERSTITRANAAIGIGDSALSVAEGEGLVAVSLDRVVFRHPLVRSAVYRGAAFQDRERVHRALADVLDAPEQADRRAWHLAMATSGRDDAVAAALEQTAERAHRRAGYAGAASALARAAELSGSPADRARRMVRAARAAWQAGQRARAVTLLEAVDVPATEPLLRAERGHVRGLVEIGCGSLLTAGSVLLAGADAVARYAPHVALEMLLDAGLAAGRSGNFALMAQASSRAATLPMNSDVDELLRDLLVGVASFTSAERASDLDRLRSAIARAEQSADFRVLGWAAFAAGALGADGLDQALVRSRAAVRAFGAVPAVVILLETEVVSSLLAGRYGFAAEAEEGLLLAREVGLDNAALAFVAGLAWLAALRGDGDACDQHVTEIEAATGHDMAMAYSVGQWAAGLLDLARGAPERTVARLVGLSEASVGQRHPFFATMATPELVEALLVLGREAEAARVADALLRLAAPDSPYWIRGLAARCRAMLSAPADRAAAVSAYDESIALLANANRPFDAARSRLSYGQFLRRQRRRADAREHLRAALDGFERLGAEPWAERARAELRATGETARRRDAGPVTDLTPQELQIARLVSAGNSNKDVATQLFLSPRTVEYHLAKVFNKLGISSRAQLISQAPVLIPVG